MKILGHSLWDTLIFFAWFLAALIFMFLPDTPEFQIDHNDLAFLILISTAMLLTRTEKKDDAD